MESRLLGDQAVATPHLHIAYAAQDSSPFRERGATWKLITEDVPEPMGICPLGGVQVPDE